MQFFKKLVTMKPLNITARKDSPEVSLNPNTNKFTIMGICHPENVTKFFAPVEVWLDTYLREIISTGKVNPIQLVLFFRYFNSATYKYLLYLLSKFKAFQDAGVQVSLDWYYEPEDEEMRESCIELFEFSELKIPFRCIKADGTNPL